MDKKKCIDCKIELTRWNVYGNSIIGIVCAIIYWNDWKRFMFCEKCRHK